MKAKVKSTGIIINVCEFDSNGYGRMMFNGSDDNIYKFDELDFNVPQPIDWDAKLIELSGKAMQGIISSKRYYTVDTQYCISTYTYMENSRVASLSVGIAKELIKQLKEEMK